MLTSVDLFSGIGGFALALKGVATPILYCDISETVRETLSSLMQRGKLPKAPIIGNIKNFDEIVSVVRDRQVDIITAGFPCLGFSKVGNMEGFNNSQSALFWDTMKIVKILRPHMVLLENVAEIVNANDGNDMAAMIAEFTKLGFGCKWTIQSAQSVGAPQVRKRWFCLATSQKKLNMKTVKTNKFVSFDWSQKSMPSIVSVREADFARRYSMLGNSIVPAAARAAFIKLYAGEDDKSKKTYQTFPEIVLDPRHFKAFKEGDHAQRLRVHLFPTPRAQMWRRSYTLTARNTQDLPTFVLFIKKIGDTEFERPTSEMVVNINFVEWLMGYPSGWTKI